MSWLGVVGLVACRAAPVERAREAVESVAEGGIARVAFEVDADAFRLDLAVDEPGAVFVRVERLVGPDGVAFDAERWRGAEQLTQAVWDRAGSQVFAWPVRAIDGPLAAGAWEAEIRVVDIEGRPLDGVPLRGELTTKRDPNLRRGVLRAAVVRSDALEIALADALPDVFDHWARSLGRAGVELDLTERWVAGLPALAPHPSSGDPSLAALRPLDPDVDLVVWLADDLVGGLFGAVDAIPSSPAVGGLVVVSLTAAGGPDGRLDASDREQLGVALAHETGHALGLFHPIELDRAHRDALDDTPECDDPHACERQLGDLVMFPYVVCEPTCDPPRRWTREQRGVLHRATAVR